MLLVSIVKQGDGQPFESRPPAPPKIVKEPNPIPARAPKSFTMGRNRRSRWPGIGVHVAPESVFTMARKTQILLANSKARQIRTYVSFRRQCMIFWNNVG